MLLEGQIDASPCAMNADAHRRALSRSSLLSHSRASGSGSTYVYGYCDATYRDNMSEEETVNFVKNSEFAPGPLPPRGASRCQATS